MSITCISRAAISFSEFSRKISESLGSEYLDLSHNYLWDSSSDQLKQAFSVVPSTVIALNLMCNGLGRHLSDEGINTLVLALRKIPVSVKHVDLRLNCLENMSPIQIFTILSSLPVTSTIDLSGASWSSAQTKAIALSGKSVQLWDSLSKQVNQHHKYNTMMTLFMINKKRVEDGLSPVPAVIDNLICEFSLPYSTKCQDPKVIARQIMGSSSTL